MSNEKTHFGLPFPTEQLALAELHKQRVESVQTRSTVDSTKKSASDELRALASEVRALAIRAAVHGARRAEAQLNDTYYELRLRAQELENSCAAR
jgi:hypothetical protein